MAASSESGPGSSEDDQEKLQSIIDHCAGKDTLVVSANDVLVNPLGQGPESAARIGKMLAVNTSLFVMHIDGHSIGDAGLVAIAAGLKANKKLHTLRISNDETIGEKGVTALAGALRGNTTLCVLSVDRCSVGPNGAKALGDALAGNSKLQSLILDGDTQIGDRGAQDLAQCFWEGSALTLVSVVNCGIGAKGACALAGNASKTETIRTLSMYDNPDIGDTGVAGVAMLLGSAESKLDTLILSRCGIGDKGAEMIAHTLKTNTSLTSLYLNKCPIGNTGIAYLAGALTLNGTLRTLMLDATNTGDMGAYYLARMLKDNSTLTRLALRNCRISALGIDHLADALESNTTLEALGLDLEHMGMDLPGSLDS